MNTKKKKKLKWLYYDNFYFYLENKISEVV